MLSVGSARQFILTRKATLLPNGKGGGEASGVIVVFYLHLRAASPSPASTTCLSWQPRGAHESLGWAERGGARACAQLAGRQPRGTTSPPRTGALPGQGEKWETEANWLVLLQQVYSRNNTWDQTPSIPLFGSMGSLCYMKDKKFPTIQNRHGNRQVANLPTPVPFQEEAIVEATVIPFFLFSGNA